MAYCKANSCYDNVNYSWEDYCSYHQKCLSKLQEYKSISNIQEIETFGTWFNGNCGYVINYDTSTSSSFPYYVWIIIYEPKQWNKQIPENLSAMKYYGYSNLPVARNKAQNLRDDLKYSDGGPIFCALNYNNSDKNFSNIATSPYVIKSDLPYSWGASTSTLVSLFFPTSSAIDVKVPTKEPDKYLRPLDIVKSYMGGFYHVGVYLGRIDGEYKVCHFTKEFNGTRIHSWKEFVEGNIDGGAIRYHPVIPFKNYRKIAQQIAWAESVGYRENNYDLTDRNCEHFANMIVYGVDHSEQIEEKRRKLGSDNYWMMEKKLIDEMIATDNKLGRITNSRSNDIETRYLQEVPPKQNCQIM